MGNNQRDVLVSHQSTFHHARRLIVWRPPLLGEPAERAPYVADDPANTARIASPAFEDLGTQPVAAVLSAAVDCSARDPVKINLLPLSEHPSGSSRRRGPLKAPVRAEEQETVLSEPEEVLSLDGSRLS